MLVYFVGGLSSSHWNPSFSRKGVDEKPTNISGLTWAASLGVSPPYQGFAVIGKHLLSLSQHTTHSWSILMPPNYLDSMTMLLVLCRQVWQYKKRGQGCSSRPVLPLALPHRPHGRHRHTCHVSQVPVSSDRSGHAREINWHLKNDSENNVDRFARDENVYQGRADMLHFRLIHSGWISTLSFSTVVGFRKKANGTKINHKLYCSEISKVRTLILHWTIWSDWYSTYVPDQSFVMEKYRIPARTIHVLANNEPHTLCSYDGDDIYFLQVHAKSS